MTPTKAKILNRTGLNEEQYEKIVFNTFLMCLSEISRTPQHLQLLLINQPISKWFLTEVSKFNEEFYNDTIPFIPLDKKHVETHYRRAIRRIARHYPSALIDRVKVNNNANFLFGNFAQN